jgi:hypothetical protein
VSDIDHQAGNAEQRHRNGFLGFWDREGTRILVLAIGVLGGMAWNGIKDDVAVVKTAQVQQQLSLLKIEGLVAEGVIRDVKQTQADNKKQDERLEQHDERLRALERVTPVK